MEKWNIICYDDFSFYGTDLPVLHKWYKLNDIQNFLIYETVVSGFRVLKLGTLNNRLNLQKEVCLETWEY